MRARCFQHTTPYEGPPSPVEGLERLAPEHAADQLAAVDARA